MTRLIELSHWGNIAVEESFTVEHVGAKLKVSELDHAKRYHFIFRTRDPLHPLHI